jgi:hypothetical protein
MKQRILWVCALVAASSLVRADEQQFGYGSQRWWATLTSFHQLSCGGEFYPGQPDRSLHLIEKTKSEVRLKVGFNF